MLKRLLVSSFLFCVSVWGQSQPPGTYQLQLVTFNGAPFGPCDVYQVALNVTNGNYYTCIPGTRTWTPVTSFLSANNAFTGNNTHTGTETFSNITSSTANPAATGLIKLANADSIKWRNFANGGDILLGLNGNANGNIPADIVTPQSGFGATFFAVLNSANISLTGGIRFASTDFLAWRNNANSADLSLSKNSSDILIWPNSIGIGGTIQSNTGTATMGLTLKKGSGAGNYTNANTTYAVADSTNLCYTVTVPVGWKLEVRTSGGLGTSTAVVEADVALTDNAACSTANAGILTEAPVFANAAGNTEPFSLNWVITGDGNSHNIALQFKTTNASDTANLLNSSATRLPTMSFTLMPSN